MATMGAKPQETASPTAMAAMPLWSQPAGHSAVPSVEASRSQVELPSSAVPVHSVAATASLAAVAM